MRQLPLNALRAFAAVYASGGVRHAARTLGISHSSVSRHLAELESWLGVALTEPAAGRRGLSLTTDGDLLGRAAYDALAALENATLQVQEARTATSVVISVAPSFATRWLLPRLPDLEERHPEIEVSVTVDQKPVQLEAGKTDVAIRMASRPPRGVRCSLLMDDALYPVMSEAFWERAGRPTRPEHLIGQRLLHDRDPNASWAQWRAEHGPEKLDVVSGPRYTSSDLVLRAAALGRGVALARHRLVQEDLDTGLLLRPIAGLAVPIPAAYWLLTPERPKVLRPAVRKVVAWIEGAARARQVPVLSN